MQKVDFLILGQGLAGTILATMLQKRGLSFRILDQGHEGSASKGAAGIVNPITGRYYIKTWLAEALIPFAKAYFKEQEAVLQNKYWWDKDILRSLPNARSENQWHLRSTFESYQQYLADDVDMGHFGPLVNIPFPMGKVCGGGQVDIKGFIQDFQKKWLDEGLVIETKFEHKDLIVKKNSVQYSGFEADRIIFAEGCWVKNNPYFSELPFLHSKGEYLCIEVDGPMPKSLLKHKIFYAPMPGGYWWVGSNYDQVFDNEIPSEKHYISLSKSLEKHMTCDYRIISHNAAVRPTVSDTRPFIGTHAKHPQLVLFNGLGTKGATLGPFFAKHLLEHLIEERGLMVDVDIRRFRDGYVSL